MYAKMKGLILPCEGDTLAEGIAVKQPGLVTSGIVRSMVDDIVLASERDMERALSMLLQIENTVVEGAGAAGLAALLGHPKMFRGRNVGIILTGGNIDTRLLANVMLRDLARSGRLARLSVRLQDRPGALFHVARVFDEQQVNIVEVYHQRVFTTLPAKGLIAEIECETRDAAHLERLLKALDHEGYEVQKVGMSVPVSCLCANRRSGPSRRVSGRPCRFPPTHPVSADPVRKQQRQALVGCFVAVVER
jgi:threonine dehydratase